MRLTGEPGRTLRRIPQPTARLREAVAPAWLIEAVRPRQSPVPWDLMVRAALAVGVPLTAGFVTGRIALGLLPAMGGLSASVVDIGGPYPARIRRVGCATGLGGTAGLLIGSLIHGQGWVAVAVLVLVAGVSALMSAGGSTASVTGLQLIVYAALGTGPLGALRPLWHTPLLFLAGAAWAILLILPGWILFPHAAEQRSVAEVYRAVARELRTAGTEEFAAARLGLTNALNAAYDQLRSVRASSSGRDRRLMRLVALLIQSHLLAEAGTTVALEGNRPPAEVSDAAGQLADAIQSGAAPPDIPPPWRPSAGAESLSDALAGAARLLTTDQIPAAQQRLSRPGPRERLDDAIDNVRSGRLIRLSAARLMVCVGVAAVMSEILPLQRSYWVVLTVAIVMKPDFGSVFTRAIQRGLGTVVGAAGGAVIVAAVPYGPLLLIPVAVFAGLLPYGRSRNYGLMSVFLTPLVVLLIDLPNHTGWHLAEARLIDTLLGCGIALVIGYAPWPTVWTAHLPGQFADTVSSICEYLEQALVERSSERYRLRRRAYRALSDLRAEFQRTLSEPAALSRRATTWWPAVVGLEQVMDAITAAAVAADHGAALPEPDDVHALEAALRGLAEAVRSGTKTPEPEELPAGQDLSSVTDAVRRVQAVLA
jgi:uncharacterized membrane protein YccC